MFASDRLLTHQEYARLPEGRRPTELVRGRIVEFDFGSFRHGLLCCNVAVCVANFVHDRELGHVCCNDTGVITQRNPDTVRGADVSFYSYTRVPPGPLPWAYLDVAPDLIFEVFPAERSWKELLEKVYEFLDAGVDAVCVLNDEIRSATLYHSEGERVFTTKEQLVVPGILPEFRVPMRELFED